MVKHWYVVHTYAGFENKAKAALEDGIRRSGFAQRFGEVLVPTEKVVEVKDGQKKTTTRKVFPGYMFVQMEVDNETWHLVKSTPKVTGFIGGSRNPPPVPEDEVKRITHQMTEEQNQPKPVMHFERGEEIRIIDGPFSSMTGKVEEVNQPRAKLRVMVTIFGRPTSVELDFTQVERPG
jgi:transcriptional antiterminator NusG